MQRATLGKSGSEAVPQLQGRIARAFSSKSLVNTMEMAAAIQYILTAAQSLGLRITQFCRIKGCGGAGCPPTNNFRKTQVTPTNYISSEREFIGESESFKISGKYFDFAIL